MIQMHLIKPFLLIILILSLCSFKAQSPISNRSYLAKWVIMNGCSLKVEGSTNVNKFNCVISNYSKPDTIILIKENQNSEAIRLNGSMDLDVLKFDCHNPVMSADLRKTLKAKIYPHLKIKFLSFNKLPDLTIKQQAITGMVEIELAGVKKKFQVNYKVAKESAQTIRLIGNQDVNFSDFNIVPPRKIGGMIQTNNELTVEFNLKMKQINL
jgi:hypothetical protein